MEGTLVPNSIREDLKTSRILLRFLSNVMRLPWQPVPCHRRSHRHMLSSVTSFIHTNDSSKNGYTRLQITTTLNCTEHVSDVKGLTTFCSPKRSALGYWSSFSTTIICFPASAQHYLTHKEFVVSLSHKPLYSKSRDIHIVLGQYERLYILSKVSGLAVA